MISHSVYSIIFVVPVTMDSKKDTCPSIKIQLCEQLANFLEQCENIKLNKDSSNFLKQQDIDGAALLEIMLLNVILRWALHGELKNILYPFLKKKKAFGTYE